MYNLYANWCSSNSTVLALSQNINLQPFWGSAAKNESWVLQMTRLQSSWQGPASLACLPLPKLSKMHPYWTVCGPSALRHFAVSEEGLACKGSSLSWWLMADYLHEVCKLRFSMCLAIRRICCETEAFCTRLTRCRIVSSQTRTWDSCSLKRCMCKANSLSFLTRQSWNVRVIASLPARCWFSQDNCKTL